jgi:WxcM-like, C-terminal
MHLNGDPMALSHYADHRGTLVKLSLKNLEFSANEIFWINNVPINVVRGGHAHFSCIQQIFLIKGKVSVLLENKELISTTILDTPGESILIKPMTWSEQIFLAADSEIVVVASHAFDETDYIRNKKEFRRL